MHIPHNFCHWSMFRLLIRDVKSVGNMADRLCRVSWSRVTCNNIMEKKICSNCSTSISRGHTTRKSTIMDQGLIQRGVKNYMHIISPRTWPSQLLSVFFLLLNQTSCRKWSCTGLESHCTETYGSTVAWNQLCIRCIILSYSSSVCPCSNRSSKQLKKTKKYTKWRTLGLQTDHHPALSPSHLGVPYNMC